MKVLYALNNELFKKIFSQRDQARISSLCDVIDVPVPAAADKDFLLNNISDADILISSWGTQALEADILDQALNLKLLCHAAGSVKPVVSDAFWEKKLQATSAAAAIAFGVAEFCLGLILTATKRAFWGGLGTRQGMYKQGIECFGGPNEIYQQKVGVIGASHVGRHLIRLLHNFSCDVVLYDPYCSREKAEELSAAQVDTLDELFSQCMVVSLNAPSTDETKHMIRGSHFAQLPEGALFVNTARSAIVHEEEMIEELKKGKFVACIDVTDPEPTLLDSPLRNLANVWLTPHEAGVVAQNMLRIGTFVADEIEAFTNGKPFIYPVTQEMLSRIG